jgi:putative ABC transport system ATP-binding protein
MIELDGVTKVYGNGEVQVRALGPVDLLIEEGDLVAIMGPSGSGKSTMMNILGCLDVPSGGRYTLDGVDVSKLRDNKLAAIRNTRIGFVFQSFNLISRTSAVRNVELPLIYAGDKSRRRERALAALERVGLGERAGHMPNELSGGQQQRVAVARAVAGKPLVLLADEPTGNLDSRNGAQVMELLQELHAGGATIVMVTHDPRYIGRAGRNVFLFDGRVVAHPPAELEVA